MRHAALAIAMALLGCAAIPAHDGAPAARVRIVRVPAKPVVKVIRETPAPCVKRKQIPQEPPLIGNRLAGLADFDVGPLAQSARELRTSLRRALGLLRKCAK